MPSMISMKFLMFDQHEKALKKKKTLKKQKSRF